jgi:hypothetical protein
VAATINDDVPAGVSWKLTALASAATTPVEIAHGSGTVSNAPLATIDPDALADETYKLALTATDAALNSRTVELNGVTIVWNLPAYGLRVHEMDVAYGTHTFTIDRVYDDTRRATDGELGFGWILDMPRVDYQVTLADPGAAPDGCGYVPYTTGTRVVATLPGGTPMGFTFEWVVAHSLFGIPLDYAPQFTPDMGVTAGLVAPEVYFNQAGPEDYIDYGTGCAFSPANPAFGNEFRLQLADGTVYQTNATTLALARLSNTADLADVSFDASSIVTSDGLNIPVNRDAHARVVGLGARTFGYDAAGDLVSASGMAYEYWHLGAPHYLKH